MRTQITVLLSIVLLAITVNVSAANEGATLSTSDSIFSLKNVRAAFPAAASYEKANKGVYKVYGKNKEIIGAVILSSPYATGVKGFAGPTPLLIAIDKRLHIKDVQLLRNSDTPNFVEHALEGGLLKSWNNMLMNKAANKEVDAVSGATYTSTAVIKNFQMAIAKAKVSLEEKKLPEAKKDSIKNATAKGTQAAKDTATAVSKVQSNDTTAAATDTLGTEVDHTSETAQINSSIPTSVWIKNIVTVIVAILGMVLFFRPKLNKRWYIPMTILSIIVLGFWLKSMLSLSQFINWFRQGIPFSMQWGLLVLAVLSLGLPLFFGKKYYCVYICPFGGLQELVGKVNKHKISISQRALQIGGIIRKAILLALLMLLILMSAFDFSLYEPLSIFNFVTIPNMAPIVALVIAIAAVVLSIFISKPWCRFVCPLGQTLDLFVQKKNKG